MAERGTDTNAGDDTITITQKPTSQKKQSGCDSKGPKRSEKTCTVVAGSNCDIVVTLQN